MNLAHLITEGTYAYSGLLKKQIPTIIYAPGRVGSMGLIKNLRAVHIYTFKVESFLTEKSGGTQFVKKHFLEKEKPMNIITLVRDPLAMMATYYYSKMIRGWIPGAKEAYEQQDIKALQKIFIDLCLSTTRLDSHLYWYENDWQPSLGFSIFDLPFDKAVKHNTFEHGRFRVLAMRSELDDTIKTTALEEFLGAKNLVLTRENVRLNKPGSEGYQEFKDTLVVPESLLEKIYTAPYVTHFFTEEEIISLKTKWGLKN